MNFIRSIRHSVWWAAPWRFRMGFRNFWRFRKAVWHFHACDWTGLVEIMEVAITEMRNAHRDYSMCVDQSNMVRELTIVKELCRRLREENHTEDIMKRDENYLSNLLRNVRCWWY